MRVLYIILVFLFSLTLSAQTCEHTINDITNYVEINGVGAPLQSTYDVNCGDTLVEYRDLHWFYFHINTTIAECEACRLPIELLMISYNGDYLRWVTSSETNNDFFMVTIKDKDYQPTDSFKVDGGGTINSISKYEYYLPDLEYNYIELSQKDYDGTRDVVGEIYFDKKEKLIDIVLAPNPSNNGKCFVMGNDENDVITVYDTVGREIKVMITNNTISGLASGIYIVAVGGYFRGRLIIN